MIDIDGQHITRRFALLDTGFRPFFIGAAGFAVVSMLIWMGAYVFGWKLQLNSLTPMEWHAHEMIYGYSMAVVAGFLLTAVINWTGIKTLAGTPLLLLSLLWLTSRILFLFGNSVSIVVLAITDNLFIVVLISSTAAAIIKARQWNHIAIISKLLLVLIANILFYLGVLGILSNGVYLGLYTGLYLILALAFTMGRRVIPFFIEKGVGYPVSLTNRKWLDYSSLVLFILFWIADIFIQNAALVALLAGMLFILHCIRISGWYTYGIWKKPLLWVLLLSYGSMIVGFALKVAVFVFGLSPYLAVHAFGFGGLGMLTIGMMSRVALGHTGRNVFDPPAALFWMFAILFTGAVIRVLAPLVDPSHHVVWIGLSQGLWIISFSMFLYIYFPMLIRPRVDGRVG